MNNQIKEPPKELKELIDNKTVLPSKALELGCGEGLLSIYLAKNGFDVTAIDISRDALRRAKSNAERAGVKVNFKILDVLNLNQLNDKFAFILDWNARAKLNQLDGHFLRIDRLLENNGFYLLAFITGSHSNIRDSLAKYFVIVDERNIKIFDKDSSFDGSFFILKKK